MTRMKASLKRVQLDEHGKGVTLSFSASAGNGRSGPVPQGFDPWTANFDPSEIFKHMGTPALAQWSAAQVVLQMRAVVEAGDGVAVLKCMSLVAAQGLVAPDWLAAKYVELFRKFERHEVASLDEAFGNSPVPERKRAAMADRHSLVPEVSERLVAVIHSNPLTPIDGVLFGEVGRRLGIGATLCRELYDEGVKVHGLQDLKQLKRLLKRAGKSGEKPVSASRVRRR